MAVFILRIRKRSARLFTPLIIAAVLSFIAVAWSNGSSAQFQNSTADSVSDSVSGMSGSDSARLPELDRMTVVGGKFGKEMATAQSVSFIKLKEWAGTGEELADILAAQSGVQTRRFGGRGSFQTISIRGGGSEEVRVLLDGIPLNSPMGGAVDLGKISPLRLGSIEVYRGIVPARFGGNSLGGVVNLVSRQPAQGEVTEGELRTMIGSYGTEEFSTAFSSRADSAVTLFSQVQFEQSDNRFPYLDRNNTFFGTAVDPAADDTVRRMENNQYTTGNLLVHPVVHCRNGDAVIANVELTYIKANQPAMEGKINRTALAEEKNVVVSTRWEPRESYRDVLRFIPAAALLWRTGRRFVSSVDQSAGASHTTLTAPDSYWEIQTTEKAVHIPLTIEFRPLEHIGADARISADAGDIAPELLTHDETHGDWHSREATVDVAADINGRSGVAAMRISFGGKGVKCRTDGGWDPGSLNNVPASDTITALWSAGGGVSLQLHDSTVLVYGNGGRYSNQPTLQQRYGARGAYNPNPDLLPEYGYQGEAGVKYDGSHLYAELCFFYNRIHDKIITVFDGRQMTAVNCSGARITGLESDVVWQVNELIKGQSAVTLQRAINLARENNWYGRKLPDEPDLTITESVTMLPVKSLTLQYRLDLKSFYYRTPSNNKWSDRVPRLNADGTGSLFDIYHNVMVQWNPASCLSITLSAINLTGKLLTEGEFAAGSEGAYSWVVYPANEVYLTARYTF